MGFSLVLIIHNLMASSMRRTRGSGGEVITILLGIVLRIRCSRGSYDLNNIGHSRHNWLNLFLYCLLPYNHKVVEISRTFKYTVLIYLNSKSNRVLTLNQLNDREYVQSFPTIHTTELCLLATASWTNCSL